MNIPLITHLLNLIEEIFKADAPVVEKAVTEAAITTVETDPKVQAITAASAALVSAAQNLKTAVQDTPSPTPPPPPETNG